MFIRRASGWHGNESVGVLKGIMQRLHYLWLSNELFNCITTLLFFVDLILVSNSVIPKKRDVPLTVGLPESVESREISTLNWRQRFLRTCHPCRISTHERQWIRLSKKWTRAKIQVSLRKAPRQKTGNYHGLRCVWDCNGVTTTMRLTVTTDTFSTRIRPFVALRYATICESTRSVWW